MTKLSLFYLDKLKHNVSKILVFTIIIYSFLIVSLYQYYQKKLEMERIQLLQDYCSKILEVSTNKIDLLTQQISCTLQNNNISIRNNNSDLEVCCDKCVSYNLLEFEELIDKHIPKFIYYKIELNKNFLYSNINTQNYQIEKSYYLNSHNQLSVSLAIDKLYWNKIEVEMKKPFWIITLFILVNILSFYFFSKVLFKNFNKEFRLYYQNKYKKELDQLRESHSKELKNCTDSLMNKIWNLNFNKQKDLEINCLLAIEANKLSLTDENTNNQESILKDSRLKNFSDKIPCSIILYQENKIEEINAVQLVELFKDRFDQENENILVEIISRVRVVNFSSRAALYQIIYSIISYLIFIIDKRSSITKHNIKLIIDQAETVIKLYFEYDGLPITEEKELLKMSNSFFKTHANPFLLNINQVFSILRNNGFDCNIKHNRCNIIEILQKNPKGPEQTEGNIIHLSTFIKEKK